MTSSKFGTRDASRWYPALKSVPSVPSTFLFSLDVARGAGPLAASRRMDVDVVGDGVPLAEVFVARSRQVRVAVETLERALGTSGGAYLDKARAWERSLDPSAPKLKAFPPVLTKSGTRLPAALHAARDAFIRSIGHARNNFRGPVAAVAKQPKKPKAALNAEARRLRSPAARARTRRVAGRDRLVPCCASCATWQFFEAPVPSSASSAEALLAALGEWVRAEASSIRAAAACNAAKAYAAALAAYAEKIGKDKRWKIPRVGKSLRVAACAVSESASERLKLAVALYRDKYRALLSPAEKAQHEAAAKRERDQKRHTKKMRTKRNDVIAKCAVRRPQKNSVATSCPEHERTQRSAAAWPRDAAPRALPRGAAAHSFPLGAWHGVC